MRLPTLHFILWYCSPSTFISNLRNDDDENKIIFGKLF